MASYQDIETRLQVVEAKIDFALRAFGVQSQYEHPLQPGKIIVERRTLLDEYHRLNRDGLMSAALAEARETIDPAPAVIDAEVAEVAETQHG